MAHERPAPLFSGHPCEPHAGRQLFDVALDLARAGEALRAQLVGTSAGLRARSGRTHLDFEPRARVVQAGVQPIVAELIEKRLRRRRVAGFERHDAVQGSARRGHA